MAPLLALVFVGVAFEHAMGSYTGIELVANIYTTTEDQQARILCRVVSKDIISNANDYNLYPENIIIGGSTSGFLIGLDEIALIMKKHTEHRDTRCNTTANVEGGSVAQWLVRLP